VTLTSQEAGPGRTEMTLRHAGLPAAMLDDCRTGWNESFDKLEETL